MGRPLNHMVQFVCPVLAVQLIHQRRKSPVRNWLYEMAIPKPIAGSWSNLEHTVVFQLVPYRILDLDFGVGQRIKGLSRVETSARYPEIA